jgi:cation/acetate symporter
MTSTTYVQFLKGGLLIVFSVIVTVSVLMRGLSTDADQGGAVPAYQYGTLAATEVDGKVKLAGEAETLGYAVLTQKDVGGVSLVKLSKAGAVSWWKKSAKGGAVTLDEGQYVAVLGDGTKQINGAPASDANALRQTGDVLMVEGKKGAEAKTGSLGPFEFLAKMASGETLVRTWKPAKFEDDGQKVTVYYPALLAGNKLMRPGLKFKVEGTLVEKLDFISLMLALFLGTAALPHILIRYYTVSTPSAARKSTIVAIAAIGFFYVLTLYMGLGAMVNNVVNPADSNMAAPLLARSFGMFLFALISATAFATVLGTVAGLIVAASGAVAHDLMDRYMGITMDDRKKVLMGKIAAFVVGIIAIVLGIIFQGVNVTFLVGLAFAVAASANLPSIIMLLFWKKTTAKGIVASITVGIVTSIGIILFSPDMYELYGKLRSDAPIPFANPGLFSIPASFITLVVVSLFTQKPQASIGAPSAAHS